MNQSNLPNPFVFACGVPRSGTTLLQRMLDSHPLLAVANDSHFIPRALELTDKALIQTAESGNAIDLTPKLLANVRDYHRFRRLGISEKEFESATEQSATFQELVSALYVTYATKHGKQWGGEKTPDYLRRLRLLHGLFPKSKLLHIVRDGRSVALSLMQWATPNKGPGRIKLWEQHPIAVCALWWRWMIMEAGQQSAEIDSSVYFEFRYEDVVQEPKRKMQEVCTFLGIEYSPQMLEYHVGKSKPAIQLSAKSAWLAPQSGLRNWKEEMTSEQIELFEILASDALQTKGYELHAQSYSDQTRETAKACTTWWESCFLPKHRPKGFGEHPKLNEKTDQANSVPSANPDSPAVRLGKVF